MACCQYRPAAVRKPEATKQPALAPRPAALLPACGPASLRAALLAVAALSALAGTARADEAAPPAADARPIVRLLPQTRNHKICFTARFDDARVDLVRSKGAQARLQSIAAQLYWDDAEPIDYSQDGWGYDRRYELMLAARVAGHSQPLVGGLECHYRDRALVDAKTGKIIDGPSTDTLACFQDCDGGTLAIEASASDKSLTLIFKDGAWPRLHGGELHPASPVSRIRLEPADASQCRALDEETD
jgi:hypothetical protein